MSTQKITRAQLAEKYNSIKSEIENIETSDEMFLYATHSKYIPKLGYVSELSMQGVVQAAKVINDSVTNNFDKEMAELGIEASDLGIVSNDKFLGINVSIWKNDLKTRVKELRQAHKLAALKKDAEIIFRNLDKENLFDLEMSNLSEYSL